MKILRKLTLKNLKLNRTRTLVTIIGIMLSAALITVVAGVATSGQQTMVNAVIQSKGDYTLQFKGNFSTDTAEKLLKNRDVQSVYESNSVGVARFKSKSTYKPYVYISGLDKDAFGNCFKTTLKEGRYPESTDELVLSPLFMKHSEKTYKVGNTITLNIGNRWTKGEVSKNNIPTSHDKNADCFIDTDTEYFKNTEDFIPEFEKTYKIVGILDIEAGDPSPNSYGACTGAYTLADFSDTSQRSAYYDYSEIYVKLNPDAEGRCAEVISEITGIDLEYIEQDMMFDDAEDAEKAYEQLNKNPFKIESFSINSELLKYKGFGLSDDNLRVIYNLAIIIIVIIVLSSVFIIRNSFAISITEKTKLYGMMSSTGATPRQIKHNVYFEGFILGLIGIPLGILLGVGVTAVLIWLVNVLLAEGLNNITVAFCVSWYAIAAAVLLGLLTIFFSSFSIARRASKISPIDAIRSNNDIKIRKKKKEKSYKVPKYINRLFGAGGSIAWKNLKRSRKKYRTTVISIVVSVATFISVYSFVDYGLKFYSNYNNGIRFNMYIDTYSLDEKTSFDETTDKLKQIAEFEGVRERAYGFNNVYYCFHEMDSAILTDEVKAMGINETDVYVYGDTAELPNSKFVALDDISYKDIISRLGYKYNEVKDKGLIVNTTPVYNKDGYTVRDDNGKPKKLSIFKNIKGLKLDGELSVDENDDDYDWDYRKITVELAGEIDDESVINDYADCNYFGTDGSILVSLEWFKQNTSPLNADAEITLNAENPDELEQKLTEFDNTIYVMNYAKQARIMNAMLLVVQIFVYGFILVISLIGITNIFNTITTNMQLRRKEFAMLRSVGMTNKEFNRMIRLESLFYTVRALIIGIPLGLLGGYLINLSFNEGGQLNYFFPWPAVLISVATVMLVVRMIMRFSIGKVRKQNIIETIRNDNI